MGQGRGQRDSGFGNFNFSRAPRQHPQYETDVTISLEEAYHGTRRDLSVNINGQNKTIPLKIPKGILPGTKIKIRGSKFGLDGDLYVKIQILDSNNRLDGLNLTKTLRIAPWEAYFGTEKPWIPWRKTQSSHSEKNQKRSKDSHSPKGFLRYEKPRRGFVFRDCVGQSGIVRRTRKNLSTDDEIIGH